MNKHIDNHIPYKVFQGFNLERKGFTAQQLMKRRIKERFDHATKKFKNFMKKNKYTEFDLVLIGANEQLPYVERVEKFTEFVFGAHNYTTTHLKKILTSAAFRQGKLSYLNRLIPMSINTEKQLGIFVRNWERGISNKELILILKHVGHDDWPLWLKNLEKRHRITKVRERWYY